MPTTFVTISHPDGRTAVVPEAAVQHYAPHGWLLEGPAAGPSSPPPTVPELKKPQKNDSTARWRTYGVATSDFTVDEVFAMSRDELAEHYTPSKPPAPDTAVTPQTDTKES